MLWVPQSLCAQILAENHTTIAPQIHQNLYSVILADTPIRKPSPIYRYIHQSFSQTARWHMGCLLLLWHGETSSRFWICPETNPADLLSAVQIAVLSTILLRHISQFTDVLVSMWPTLWVYNHVDRKFQNDCLVLFVMHPNKFVLESRLTSTWHGCLEFPNS